MIGSSPSSGHCPITRPVALLKAVIDTDRNIARAWVMCRQWFVRKGGGNKYSVLKIRRPPPHPQLRTPEDFTADSW
ncbi:hypothetical protein BaRGS_00011732 [Batillaria attramentaria]|uniref:Uncharacterized protein n=1 Tax=Batillaria attramentaria TaxID=370345 RepID=A0ABD0LCX8_9CAEN